MACYSRVTATQMTDAQRIADALVALGYQVTRQTDTVVASDKGIWFNRKKAGDAFTTDAYDVAKLQEIQRKYSEIGVREWAKRKGYNVVSAEGNKLTLQNRRG